MYRPEHRFAREDFVPYHAKGAPSRFDMVLRYRARPGFGIRFVFPVGHRLGRNLRGTATELEETHT